MNTDCPVVGIDVAKESCFYAALSPAGRPLMKPFQAMNTLKGLLFVLEELKKVEKAFQQKPVIVLESTGHYSQRLVHFFHKNGFKVFLVNPLQSHSIKNAAIRKVKNDKVDAEELARLYFIQDLREHCFSDVYLENLKVLTRASCHLAEQRVSISNQLTAAVDQVFPGFTKIFDSIAAKAAMEFLMHYSSPAAVLAAAPQDIVDLIATAARRSRDYAQKKQALLRRCAAEALETGVPFTAFHEIIRVYAENLRHINDLLNKIDQSIRDLALNIPEMALIRTIPGIGEKIAPVLLAEIGDIQRFSNANQLIAFCGIDPSVKQSGNFIGRKNKFSKRGSPFSRKALYLAATVAIRKDPKGGCVNPVIYAYYQKKIQTKAKKQALGAVMNKLVRIIYAVLKDKRPFTLITPEQQIEMYRSNLKTAA